MAIGIGSFQIENLIRNRVPFFLLKDESDITKFFGPMERVHLQTYSVPLSEFSTAFAEAQLKERGVQVQTPLVVLCSDGYRSQKLAEDLESQGYLNVYYVLDGLKSFSTPS